MLEVELRQDGPIALDAKLRCESGELLALVGPSGSGKTSILRAIAGLLGVREGRIEIDGETWFDAAAGVDLPAEQRRVGMVFQSYALFPHLSALENVRLAVPRRDRRTALETAERLLRAMHLGGLAARRPHELSGGQAQRVALARALAREPRVLLLDEAFSAVDQPTRQLLHEDLAELRARRPLPIVLVTHDLREACTLADEICILDGGATLQQGPPEWVLSCPRDARTAALVGIRDIHSGTFLSEGRPRLRWGSGDGAIELEVVDKGRLAHGTSIRWVVPGEHVQLELDPGAEGRGPNRVRAEILRVSRIGDLTTLTLEVATAPRARMHHEVPNRLAKRAALESGQSVVLHVDPEGIHIMPLDPSRAGEHDRHPPDDPVSDG